RRPKPQRTPALRRQCLCSLRRRRGRSSTFATLRDRRSSACPSRWRRRRTPHPTVRRAPPSRAPSARLETRERLEFARPARPVGSFLLDQRRLLNFFRFALIAVAGLALGLFVSALALTHLSPFDRVRLRAWSVEARA